MINLTEHMNRVRLWNEKFGKTVSNYSLEYEHCLVMAEFGELATAYRKDDTSEVIDAILDIYYYYLRTIHVKDIYFDLNREYEVDDSGTNMQIIARHLNDMGSKGLYCLIQFAKELLDSHVDEIFNEYFKIVDEENHEKVGGLKNGKITKPENWKEIRKVYDTRKADLLASYGIGI